MKMGESVNVQKALNDNLFSCFVVTRRGMIVSEFVLRRRVLSIPACSKALLPERALSSFLFC